MKRITRRNLVALAAALPAAAQQPPAAPTSDDDLKTARQGYRNNAEQLAKVKLPMATEPATRFKA